MSNSFWQLQEEVRHLTCLCTSRTEANIYDSNGYLQPTTHRKHVQLEMWANAQRDGQPAEYRWRPLFNATKFGWCPLLECRAVTLPRCETCWNLQGCRSSANSEDMWGDIAAWHVFFQIVDMCLSCEDIARQICVMVPRWWLFGSCISSEPRAGHFRHAF